MFESIETLESDLIRFADAGFVLPLPFRLTSSAVGKALIQLAGGKVPMSLSHFAASDGSARSEVQKSASRFVAEVLLSPVCNHFTTLGVSPDVDAGELRDNFRRLMALVHPDARPVGFPEGAASRVNRAYAVLADPHARETYAALELGTVSVRALTPMPSASRPIETRSRRSTSSARSSRLLGWANALRARRSLLWLATVLLVPIGWALLSISANNEPQRLVETRPTPASSPTVSSLETPPALTDSTFSANAPRVSTESPVTAVAKSTPENRLVTQKATISEVAPSPFEASQVVAQPRPTVTTQLSSKSVEISSRPPVVAATNLAPTHSDIASEPPSRRAVQPEPAAVTRAPEVQPTPAPPASASTSPVSGTSGMTATNSPRVPVVIDKIEIASKVRSTDAEDVVVRFSNAFESGSIGAFSQLLSPGMPGRRQMLSEYERVFSATRQRTIKFNQLKHSASGERLATSGYAVVTTTDRDNRIMTQRVFLEFEIGRDRGEPRIERLANYVIN